MQDWLFTIGGLRGRWKSNRSKYRQTQKPDLGDKSLNIRDIDEQKRGKMTKVTSTKETQVKTTSHKPRDGEIFTIPRPTTGQKILLGAKETCLIWPLPLLFAPLFMYTKLYATGLLLVGIALFIVFFGFLSVNRYIKARLIPMTNLRKAVRENFRKVEAMGEIEQDEIVPLPKLTLKYCQEFPYLISGYVSFENLCFYAFTLRNENGNFDWFTFESEKEFNPFGHIIQTGRVRTKFFKEVETNATFDHID